jgi:hypothetical protein
MAFDISNRKKILKVNSSNGCTAKIPNSGKLTAVFCCKDCKSLTLWFSSALKTKLNAKDASKFGNV